MAKKREAPPTHDREAPEETQPSEEEQTSAETGQEISFPIVGIGASAGGLPAFEQFFARMPATTESGMAFVLVQHLDPDRKSILTDLVKRCTEMQVFEVTDGMEVQPNCAYIIPPNKDMAFMYGRLHLMEPVAPRGLRLPIDFFFRSLAQDQHEQAICIVLSGTGTDGTLGLKEIKGQGGMTMVQDPASAKYDGMPHSAIATGMVDYILPPAEMPAQLIAYVSRAFGQRIPQVPPAAGKTTDMLQKVFLLLRSQTGHDFSHYKQSTICRRIERRMAVTQIDRLEDYVRYLRQTPLEVDTLFRESLIGVTSFFRDPEAFEVLKEQAIAPLLTDREPGRPLRIWVPGCSTGEEAFSIAMLVQEETDALDQHIEVQIFATDIDAEAIDRARAGVYPDGIAADVSPERLARFFRQENGTYRIKKNIRDMVVFAAQNVIKDPPLSKMGLISCRNLLIYMEPELQKKVIPLFHYSLNPEGYLFLGSSETIGEFVDIFAVVDKKWKLFQHKGVAPRRMAVDFSAPSLTDVAAPIPIPGAVRPEREMSIRELAEKTLLEKHTPPCAIINERGDVLYIHGRTGRYLEPAPGEANLNIIRMAREGLRLEMTTAIRKVTRQRTTVHYPGLQVKTNGGITTVDLIVRPVMEPASMRNLMMVLFHDVTVREQAEDAKVEPIPTADKDRRIAELERELRTKEEYLQTAVEEMETSNEELQSSNEELQSSNEELQSTNEELETSQEELQSVNEELMTVNTELQKKIGDLSQANNDMNNLLAGTGVGTVFLDDDLIIQRFTPAATQVINLIQTDVGRPVSHIVSNLDYDHLTEDAQAVLDTLVPKEAEVQTTDGRWYLMHILPYRTLENVIEGAVLTFVEITKQKQMQEEIRRLATVVRNSNDAVTVQDFEGNIRAWNWGAETMYGWSEAEALAMNIRDIVPEDKREEAVAFVKKLTRGEIVESFETQRVCKDGALLDVWLTVTLLTGDRGQPVGVATTERDITDRKRAAQALRESEFKWRSMAENSPDYIMLLDQNANIESVNRALPDLTVEQVIGTPIYDYVPAEFRPVMKECFEGVLNTGKPERYETEYHTAGGEVRLFEGIVGPIVRDGQIVGLAISHRDITER
jgi:two-component system CheB/CheR fusion protein